MSSIYKTQDKKEPEIMLHSDYISWFEQNKVPFKAWGSSGPDFLLTKHNLIGEVKKENTTTLLKGAVKEIYERTKPIFKISSFPAFFVILGDEIRYYTQTNKDKWQDVDLDDCVVFNGKNREIFLEYINSQEHKVSIEIHLEYALDFILDDKFNMCVSDGLRLLFNLNNPDRIVVKKGVYFNPDKDDEIFISINCDKKARNELKNFLKIFTVNDVSKVKEYIKHNYSSHLPDSKKANLGKYYTPKEIVETLKKRIAPKIKENTYVMDLACGCGAFLELFDDCHILGRDIDQQAIEILDLFNFTNIGVDNTLLNVCRTKYGLQDDDDLIIIGNPPYNDTSSINKRYSTKAKSKRDPEDPDIHCRDIGRSFMEAYAKLNPRYICVLHPLSFLIKRVNFQSMKYLNSKANFQNASYRAAHHDTMLVVNYEDLWKYCYVNCIKKFLLPMLTEGNYYILGNLNPVIDKCLIESETHYWKDLFIACSILKNTHRIECMDISKRKNNMLTTRFLLNDFRRRSLDDMKGKFNFYKSFLEYVDSNSEEAKKEVYRCVIEYFDRLIRKCLIN